MYKNETVSCTYLLRAWIQGGRFVRIAPLKTDYGRIEGKSIFEHGQLPQYITFLRSHCPVRQHRASPIHTRTRTNTNKHRRTHAAVISGMFCRLPPWKNKSNWKARRAVMSFSVFFVFGQQLNRDLSECATVEAQSGEREQLHRRGTFSLTVCRGQDFKDEPSEVSCNTVN